MPTKSPPFLAVGEVCSELGISRSQLQNLFPHLPHVAITVSEESGRKTRLFPTAYILAFATFLRRNSLAATIPAARRYAQGDEATRLTTEARQRLEANIAARERHTPDQIATMLGIGRATITGWERARVFRVDRGRLRGGQVVPLGPRQVRYQGRQLIPATELRAAAQWSLPNN